MAQRSFTLPLKDTSFPMLSEQQERTIIGGSEGTGQNQNAGKPSISYCHNVMPAFEGLDSVGYLTIVPIYSPATTLFTDTRIIYGSGRTRLHLAFDSAGGAYVLKSGSTFWFKVASDAPTESEDITVATVNGVSYIYYSGTKAVTYNEITDTLDDVLLTGI